MDCLAGLVGRSEGGVSDCSVWVARGTGVWVAGEGSVDVLLEQARNNDKPTIRAAVKRPWGLCIHIQYAGSAIIDAGRRLDFPERFRCQAG